MFILEGKNKLSILTNREMEEVLVKKRQVAITLGIMCIILTFCIMVQLNTIEDATNTARKK